MKHLVASMVILIIALALAMLAGCDTYKETDMEANKTWPLMTVQEKQYYDSVEKVWGQSYLVNLREAIRNRTDKPMETATPFQDLGHIIKSTEEIVMVTGDDWKSENIKKANQARFSRIDPEWYRQITKSEPPDYPDPVEEKEEATEKVVEDGVQKGMVAMVREANSQPWNKPKRGQVMSQLISVDDYDDLKYSIRGCEAAENRFNEIVTSEHRPLTMVDYEELVNYVLLCKAQAINESLKE